MQQLITQQNLQKNLPIINFILFGCFAFFINFSTSIANIFAGLLLASAVFLIINQRQFKIITRDVVCLLFVATFFLLFLRTFHDFAQYKENFRVLMKYRELILFPFLALTFNFLSPFHRKIVLQLFILSSFMVVLISILAGLDIPYLKDLSVTPFASYIFQGIATSIAMYFAALLLFKEPKVGFRIFYSLVIILGFIDMFYFVQGGRTGYLCLFALLILLGYRFLSIKGLVLSTAVVATLFAVLFTTSDFFRAGLTRAVNEYKAQIIEGQVQQEDIQTSTGIRLEFWDNCLSIVKENPILGVGTGKFKDSYAEISLKNNYKVTKCTNPHQDFLFLASMIGIPGVMLYIFALLMMVKKSNLFTGSNSKNYYQLGVVSTLVIASLFNSPIFDSQSGNLFLLLLAMTYLFDNQNKIYD